MNEGEGPRLGGGRMVRSVNRALVYAALEGGPISRAQIAATTGLNKATVSSQVAELMEAGLIREIGIGASELGRKPLLLELEGAAGYALGVGLSPVEIRVIARDLGGRDRLELALPLPSKWPAEASSTIAMAVDRVLGQLPPARYGLVGLGIAVPGVVDSRSEAIVRATLLDWSEVELAPFFAARYHCPVFLGNDAKLAASAERSAAAIAAKARGGELEEDILCVIVGEGIGVGAFLAGRPYAGPKGYFGEAGHMTLVHGGEPCACGNRGCWDAYASQKALAAKLAAALRGLGRAPREALDAAAIVELGRSEEGAIRASFLEYADYLASGLVGLLNLFSPSAIVINSVILEAQPWLFEAVRSTALGRTMAFNRGCELRLSGLGSRAPALGAAIAASRRFIDLATEDLSRLSRTEGGLGR